MNLNDYYNKAHSGDNVDNTEILEYIKSFKKVILWGASYLGKAIGKSLKMQNVPFNNYWDLRADEIKKVDEVDVLLPFTEDDKENTLVILCIGNTAIRSSLLNKLKAENYTNVILGEYLYMGMCCKYNNKTGIDASFCSNSMECRSMFCERLHNIVKNKNDKGGIYLPNLTFMITTFCSLKCKYCVAYMNSYKDSDRRFFEYTRIAKDIDRIFTAVDSVGSITVQGGEPFLHKDIDKIIKKLLEKNFGIVIIATNGIFNIDENKLDALKDKRVNVAFSGYYDALPKEKLDIYYKNIELMKKHGIQHTVGVKVPEWIIPPTLWNRGYSEEVMKNKKDGCKIPTRCMQVMNGKLYPCLYSVSLHGIGVANYENDYVNLDDNDLKQKIEAFMNRAYYNSCGHCGGGGGSTAIAGEQGFYDFINENGGKN